MRRVRGQFLRAAFWPSFVVRGRWAAAGAVGVGLLGLGLVAGAAPAGAQDCPNAAVRAQQGGLVAGLPDCLGLEMVSPARKFVQAANAGSVSADGERVVFSSKGALGDPDGQSSVTRGDAYIATRGVDGWSVESTVPAPQAEGAFSYGWHGGRDFVRSLSPDFSRWVALVATGDQRDEGIAQLYRGALGGLVSPLSPLMDPVSPLLVPFRPAPPGSGGGSVDANMNVDLAVFEGASADHARVFFKPGLLRASYLEGDPEPAGVGSEPNSYVARSGAGGPGLDLLARDGDGKVWGGRCGARLGNVIATANAASTNGRDQGAVSADGSRVLFTTRPEQVGDGECSSFVNRLRIMRRVETSAGPWISPLFGSECARVSPVCDTTDGDDLFQGASVDGTKVYFTSSRQLTDSDLDGGFLSGCEGFFVSGCDLYLYDSTRAAGQRLVQVSAGEANPAHPTVGSGANVSTGIPAISGDGSHVYFVATGVLTTDPAPNGTTPVTGQSNLYVYQRDEDHPDGRIRFLGTAAATDANFLWGVGGTFKDQGAYPVPANGDGHVLVFRSSGAFTADDVDGGRMDVFRYDSFSHEMVRVSKAAPGGSDNGPVDVNRINLSDPSRVGTAYAEYKRWASEDGQTIVFQTPEGLSAGDGNGISDDYMWRNGELYRLPGTSRTQEMLNMTSNAQNASPALSHDGSMVVFESHERLLPQDGDTAIDMYALRVGGGFLQSDPFAGCEVVAGGCQQGDGVSLESGSRTATGGGDFQAGDRRTLTAAVTGKARRRAARTGVVAVRVVTNKPGRVRAMARARLGGRVRIVGRGNHQLARPGTVIVKVVLDRRARGRLATGRRLSLSLRVVAPGARQRSVAVVLRRAGR